MAMTPGAKDKKTNNISDNITDDHIIQSTPEKLRYYNINSIEVNDATIITWANYSNYRFLDYYLKTAFSFKVPMKILAIHNVKNEEVCTKLDQRSKSTEWTYGWCQLKASDYPNKIGEFKTKGIVDITKNFFVGTIPPQILGGPTGHEVYFWLCKLIIGHSLSVKADKAKEQKINEKKVPPYYNSIKLLTQENMTFSLNKKEANDNGLSFTYQIFKANFICPLYVVKLQQIKESEQRQNDNYFCSKCHQKEAEVFCIRCEAYFDKECYTIQHKQKGKDMNHGRYQEWLHKQKQGYCSEHESRPAEYYCKTCRRPICSKCYLIINKKINIHAGHQVWNIYRAYEEETPNFFVADEIRKRAVIQLKIIKQTVKAWIEKQVLIEKEIEHEFCEENDAIQSWTKEAKWKHFSVIAELSEMKQHLINMDNYFRKCEDAMLNAQLKPEAKWINDNYEEVITDMFNNFGNINVDYRVTPEAFNSIKQTELRITKRLTVEKDNPNNYVDPQVEVDDIIDADSHLKLTKNIISLEYEKKLEQKNAKTKRNDQKQNFKAARIKNKYALSEALLVKQLWMVDTVYDDQKSFKKYSNLKMSREMKGKDDSNDSSDDDAEWNINKNQDQNSSWSANHDESDYPEEDEEDDK